MNLRDLRVSVVIISIVGQIQHGDTESTERN